MRINACKNLRRQSRAIKVDVYFTYLERACFTKGLVKRACIADIAVVIEGNIITVGSNGRQLFSGMYCYAPSGIVGRCPVESHKEKKLSFLRRRRSVQLSAFPASGSTVQTDQLTGVLSTSIPACLPTRSCPASQPHPYFGCQNTRHEDGNGKPH